jgi:hypothetical protein
MAEQDEGAQQGQAERPPLGLVAYVGVLYAIMALGFVAIALTAIVLAALALID